MAFHSGIAPETRVPIALDQTEVQQHRQAITGPAQQIAGVDIAMHNAAAMQDSQLAQNKEVLNNVGAEHWKAQAVQLPPWKPTVVLPVPKSGEFKGAMRHHEGTGGRGLRVFNQALLQLPLQPGRLCPERRCHAQRKAAHAGRNLRKLLDYRGVGYDGGELCFCF